MFRAFFLLLIGTLRYAVLPAGRGSIKRRIDMFCMQGRKILCGEKKFIEKC